MKDLETCDWRLVTGDWWKREKQCGGWCGAANGSVEGRARVDLNAEGTEFAENNGVPHPPVFFVSVADKGLRLDAASRASREERRLTVDPSTPLRAGSLKLKGERTKRRLTGELTAE